MTDRTPGTSRANASSGGNRPRRTFSPEYKHEAARPVIDTGRTIAEVARELNVGAQSVGKWVAAERVTEAGEPTGELTRMNVQRSKRLFAIHSALIRSRSCPEWINDRKM